MPSLVVAALPVAVLLPVVDFLLVVGLLPEVALRLGRNSGVA
jgi:hypothetical protein